MSRPVVTTLNARHGSALSTMLSDHGLSGVSWRPRRPDGYSGAQLFCGQDGQGSSWVLKRTTPSQDWIMAATADSLGRESKLAACGLPLHGRVRSAAVDGVADGDNFFTLARDISPNLLTGTLRAESLNAVINGLADLHSADVDVDGGIWCPLEPRIRLLRQGIDMLPQDRDAHGLIRDVKAGWDIFHRIAPRELDELLSAVSRDFGILLRGLAELPVVLLHGDLKLDNLGLDADRTLWLIDWALVARGPACVDIGWFIAANADRIDAGPEQVLSLYSRRVGLEGGARRRHESLAALCGIMLRGWRMALDAASGIRREHFVWWCELAGDAVQFL